MCEYCKNSTASTCNKCFKNKKIIMKDKAVIIITISRSIKEFKSEYTLRGRIGIFIGELIGLIEIKENEK